MVFNPRERKYVMRFASITTASAVISLLGMIPPLTACSSSSDEEGTTDAQSIQPATATPQSVETDECVATVYAETNFVGNQLCLSEGTFTRAQLEARGFTEESIRSLTLDLGFRVRIVTDAPGGHYESTSATNAIESAALPGKVSSIAIDACTVGLFDGEDAQGAATCLGVGRYDADALTRLGLKAGSTRSVSVAPGYVLQLERTDGTTSTTDVLEFESGPLPNPGREVISARVLAKAEPPDTEAPAFDESIARMLSVEATAPGPGHTLAAERANKKPNIKDFKHVYLLGDSLTDQKNAFNSIRGLWCPNPAYGYWQGRFTNGRNWVDYFQHSNHLKGLENMAVGGSKVLNSATWRPSLMRQAEAAVAKTPKGDRGKSLVILWSGPNDLTEAAQAQKAQGGTKPASENGRQFGSKVGIGVVQVMKYLEKEGFEYLVVAEIPPLDIVPVVRTPPYTEKQQGIGKERVAYLKSAVKAANRTIDAHAGVHNVVNVPMSSLIGAYITGKVKIPEMSDVHDACQVLGGLNACSVTIRHDYIDAPCKKKMFMDQLHPSSIAHCFIKGFFENAMLEGGYSGIEFGDCGPRT
jgi:hypothetical protein